MIEVPWWAPMACILGGAIAVELGRWSVRIEDRVKRKLGVK